MNVVTAPDEIEREYSRGEDVVPANARIEDASIGAEGIGLGRCLALCLLAGASLWTLFIIWWMS